MSLRLATRRGAALFLGLLAGAPAPAFALDVALVRAEPCFEPSPTCLVDVAVGDGGRPVAGADVKLEARGGGAVAALGEVAPGRYRFVAPHGPLSVRVGGGEPRPFPVVDRLARPEPSLLAAPPVEAAPGAPLRVRFPTTREVDAARLVVTASEGRVVGTEVVEGAVVVDVEPAPDRTARVVLVGVLDLDRPGLPVVWARAVLRARQTAEVQIGAGSSAAVLVGGRRYGPYAADASGAARVQFDVLPGETSAAIVATDDLGNARTVQTPLPTAAGPVLAALAWPLAGDAGIGLAVRADGAEARMGDPVCRGPDGELALTRLGDEPTWTARWRRPPDAGSASDVLVECALGLGTARTRVQLGAGLPARVELRVYPEALASDFPLAQAQAQLVDARGDRLPPDGLTLTADLGEIVAERDGDVLRGDYRGDAALVAGGDRLEAAWVAAPGAGGVWGLEGWAAILDARLVVRARVRDREGRPLPSRTVSVTDGVSAVDVATDDRGWAAVDLPAPPDPLVVVGLRAGDLRRDVVVFPGDPQALPDPAGADLRAVKALPIRSGRVRRVFLEVSPRPLPLGGGREARVTVQLVDAAGNTVRGDDVELAADPGVIAPVSTLPDGTVEARYVPPARTTARAARITATAGGASATTELELLPRPTMGSLGVDVGWIANLSSISSPSVALTGTTRIPGVPPALVLRGTVSTWGVDDSFRDENTGQDVRVRAQFFGLVAGPEVVRRTGRFALEGGLGLAVVPHTLSLTLGERSYGGTAVPLPGLELHGGGGYRLPGGEAYVEARFLLLGPGQGAVQFDGGTGGLSGSAGYRVLF